MVRDAYVAIADPTRRAILSLLLETDVLAAGDIAARFRSVSRPAISRHLRILRECGVVIAFRHGKTHNYALNPEPIAAIRAGWMEGFADRQTQSLANLRRIVEGGADDGGG